MNLPNRLTLSRLFITLFFIFFMSIEVSYAKTVALLLFLIASITDFFDGYFARKQNLVTTFGKLMDPLADKILMAAAFIFLCAEQLLPPWVIIIMITREFLVTGIRLIASSKGTILAAGSMGKQKTILQIVMTTYYLLYLASQEKLFPFLHAFFTNHYLSITYTGTILVYSTLLITVLSGITYLANNKNVIEDM